MNNITRLIVPVALMLLTSSCGTFQKAASTDPQSNYFPAKKGKRVTILKEIPVNADTLKTLLVVFNSDYWLQMGENLDYFKSVLTYEQFQNEIIENGLAGSISNVSDKVGLHNAYNIYKPFVILSLTKVHKRGAWFAGLTLYDPKRAENIFQNEIKLNLMWDGWTDQGTMFPLFNSLLEYLRKQK